MTFLEARLPANVPGDLDLHNKAKGEGMAAVMGNGSFTINEWRVDPSLNRISRGEDVVKVDPQNMKVLELLASRPGEVFSQAEIEQSAWPDVVVTPNSVYQSIANLRRAFGDDKTNPQYIETIARKGYRCVAKIELPTSEAPKPYQAIEVVPRLASRKGMFVGTSIVGMAAAVALGLWVLSERAPIQREALGRSMAPQVHIAASRLSRAQQAVELGDAAQEARDIASALRHYQIAIDEAKGVYADTDTFFAGVFTKRAWIFQGRDEMDRALKEAQAAVEILEKNGVPTNPLFISARCIYAETLVSFRRFKEAEHQANEALRVAIAIYGDDDLQTELARASLARVKLTYWDWIGAEHELRKENPEA